MRTADWQDYELIDTSSGERLERWGSVVLIRPDPTDSLGDAEEKSALERCRRALCALLKRRRALGNPKTRAAGLDDRPRRPDVPTQDDGLQAHGAFPGAGRQLGFCAEENPVGGPAGEGAEPFRLHGRGDACLPRRGRAGLPCGRFARHGDVGA